jgi:hypothetical protein
MTSTSFVINNHILHVSGTYYAGHRGYRDRFGAPEEPDEDPGWEDVIFTLDDKEIELEDLLPILDVTEEYLMEQAEYVLDVEQSDREDEYRLTSHLQSLEDFDRD